MNRADWVDPQVVIQKLYKEIDPSRIPPLYKGPQIYDPIKLTDHSSIQRWKTARRILKEKMKSLKSSDEFPFAKVEIKIPQIRISDIDKF